MDGRGKGRRGGGKRRRGLCVLWVGGVNEGGEVCGEKAMGIGGQIERERGREGRSDLGFSLAHYGLSH